MKLLRVFARRAAAVTGRNWIDENEIGGIEPRRFVVHQMVRREWRFAAIRQFSAPRSERSEVKPHARGTRSAVKGKRDRSLCWIIADIGSRVGNIENLRLLFRLVFILVFVF